MCLNGLLISKSEFRRDVGNRFTRGEAMNLLFSFFEDSDEEIMGRGQKEKVL